MQRKLFFTTIITANALFVGLAFFVMFRAPRTKGSEPAGSYGVGKRIAIILPRHEQLLEEVFEGLRDTLQKHALFDPTFIRYNGNNNLTLLRSCIEDAIESNPDLIVSLGSQASVMTKELTSKRGSNVPVIFGATGDPIKLELIETAQSSGNNMTGVSVLGVDWIEKMVSHISYMMPHITRMLIPYDPTGLGGALEDYVQEFERVFKKYGITPRSVKIRETNEVIHRSLPFIDECDAVLVLPGSVALLAIGGLSKLCNQRKKVLVNAQNLTSLERGAAVAFGFHTYDIGVAAADSARKILEDGTAPTDIPTNPLNEIYRVVMHEKNAEQQGLLDNINDTFFFLYKNGEVID